MGSSPWYASRESLALALDRGLTVRSVEGLDRALASSTDTIEQTFERHFYPYLGTFTFDVPADDTSTTTPSWKLWLDPHDVISLASLTVGGVAVTGYQLRPDNRIKGPASWIELDRTGSQSFNTGLAGNQRRVSADGVRGWWDESRSAGALDGALTDSAEVINLATAPSAGWSSVGVGHLLKVDSERVVVEDRLPVNTGVDLLADLAATVSGTMPTSVSVASGAAWAAGEVIAVDGEWMLIERIVGNVLYVRRGYAGTAVATHTTGADIWAYRRLQVRRAAAGTTAAAHDDEATVTRWVPPPAIEALCLGLAADTAVQEGAAYARTVGEGENVRQAGQGALKALWARARPYSRKGGRHYAV